MVDGKGKDAEKTLSKVSTWLLKYLEIGSFGGISVALPLPCEEFVHRDGYIYAL